MPRRTLLAHRSVVAALALACMACGREAAAPKSVTIASGTKAMADSLQRLNALALSLSATNPFLNGARAAALSAALASQTGDQALETRFQLAEEQLKQGLTQRAIDGLESLIADAGISWDSIAPHQKPFFDLAAVAYMRLGEQQNCLDNPAANICILPLAGGARHSKTHGARGAIERYRKILRQYPEDRGSQWLLNLAYLQLGEYPGKVPAPYLIPGLAATTGGSRFPTYQNVAGAVGLDIAGTAGGVNVEDFNGDGVLDVFATGWGINDPARIYMGNGAGGYDERTPQAGLTGIVGGLNTTHADYDNDGDEDVLILRGAWMAERAIWPLSLLRNRGDGTFDDVTFASGLNGSGPTNTAAWADFDLDGHLDLFVGYESYAKINGGPSHPSRLFHNNGNGTFTEMASTVGIAIDDFVKGATWGDVNEDGLPDLFLSVNYGRNRLYINKGGRSIATWSFEETAAKAGVQLPLASFATWFFDYDNDGHLDLWVPSYDVNSAMHEMVAREYLGLPLRMQFGRIELTFEDSKLYRGRGDGTFEDVTSAMGLSRKVIFAMGQNFGDLDNDGFLDFYIGTGNPDLRSVIPNRMFHNVAGTRFEEVTLPGGFGHLQKGHAIAFADFDRDGDEDVYARIGGAYEGDVSTSVLFENPGWSGTHWVTLTLQGTSANRSAVGARVAIDVVDGAGMPRTIHRMIGVGGSFGAGPLELHVGLGAAARISGVRVQWPDAARTTTKYGPLAMDASYRIVQGAQPVSLTRPLVRFRTQRPGGTRHTMPMPGM